MSRRSSPIDGQFPIGRLGVTRELRYGDDLWGRFNADSGRGGLLWYQIEVARVIRAGLTDPGGAALAARLGAAVRTLRAQVEHDVGIDQVEADLAAAYEKAQAVRRA